MSSLFARHYIQACQGNDGKPFATCVPVCDDASKRLSPCAENDLQCQTEKLASTRDLSGCLVDHRTNVSVAQTKQDNLRNYGSADTTTRSDGTQPVQYGFRAPYANASDVHLTEHQGLQLYKPPGNHHKPGGNHRAPHGHYYKGKSGWK